MLENIGFSFNNVSTGDLGLMMVQQRGGIYNETFLSSRSINETSVYKNNKRYLKGVDIQPLSFSFSIWIKDWKDRKNLRAIARWLSTKEYAPLWFEYEPDKVYYCMVEGEPILNHNGNNEGTIDVTFRCDSNYAYSHPHMCDFKVRGSETWQFFNYGDEILYPYLKIIQRQNNQPIIIKNITDGKDFILNNVLLNEEVLVDCENRIIKSNQEDNVRYLYDDHNGYWLPFEGEEYRESDSAFEIEFQGNFDIEFNYEYKYIQQGDGF